MLSDLKWEIIDGYAFLDWIGIVAKHVTDNACDARRRKGRLVCHQEHLCDVVGWWSEWFLGGKIASGGG